MPLAGLHLRCAPAAFRIHLTPTWLRMATLMAGQNPGALRPGVRYVAIGARSALTAAVVAASHPDIEVWAAMPLDADADALAELAEVAELANLSATTNLRRVTHDADVGVVTLEDPLTCAPDGERDEMVMWIDEALRPGGVVAAAYRVLAGWSEIVPVQHTLLLAAERFHGDPAKLVGHLLALLDDLRQRDTAYIASRGQVSRWVEEVNEIDAGVFVADYLSGPMRPLSHAQLCARMTVAGCSFVGRADAPADGTVDIPAPLLDRLGAIEDPVLRETMVDLALLRRHRVDMFRRGLAPLPQEHFPPAPDEFDLGDGRTHPLNITTDMPAAVDACRRLNQVLGAWLRRVGGEPVVAAPLIGSAIASSLDELDGLAGTSGGPMSADRRRLLSALGVMD